MRCKTPGTPSPYSMGIILNDAMLVRKYGNDLTRSYSSTDEIYTVVSWTIEKAKEADFGKYRCVVIWKNGVIIISALDLRIAGKHITTTTTTTET